MDNRPIGMFDSGVGGLTVARALVDLLPHESLVYVGDTGRGPYGALQPKDVRDFAFEIIGDLVARDVKLIVVACNTATAAALTEARAAFGVPLVGVIEPGVRSAVRATRNGRVGVIGTAGTIASGAYQAAIEATRSGASISAVACPRFVEFVEAGEVDGPAVRAVAAEYLAPLRREGVDTLVLGCTHYPLLARPIADVMGRDVVLISSADETAFEVEHLLAATGQRASGLELASHQFLCSSDPAMFAALGSRFLGPEVEAGKVGAWT